MRCERYGAAVCERGIGKGALLLVFLVCSRKGEKGVAVERKRRAFVVLVEQACGWNW